MSLRFNHWVAGMARRMGVPEAAEETWTEGLASFAQTERDIWEAHKTILDEATRRQITDGELLLYSDARFTVWRTALEIRRNVLEAGCPANLLPEPAKAPEITRLDVLRARGRAVTAAGGFGGLTLTPGQRYGRAPETAATFGALAETISIAAAVTAVAISIAVVAYFVRGIMTREQQESIAVAEEQVTGLLSLIEDNMDYRRAVEAAVAEGRDPASIPPPVDAEILSRIRGAPPGTRTPGWLPWTVGLAGLGVVSYALYKYR